MRAEFEEKLDQEVASLNLQKHNPADLKKIEDMEKQVQNLEETNSRFLEDQKRRMEIAAEVRKSNLKQQGTATEDITSRGLRSGSARGPYADQGKEQGNSKLTENEAQFEEAMQKLEAMERAAAERERNARAAEERARLAEEEANAANAAKRAQK